MGDMIKMVVVLTILSAFSGGLLAAVRNNTSEQIENQKLVFVKGPAIKEIMEGSANDPIEDRFKLEIDGREESFFVGVFDGKPSVVALESFGKGYGGDVGLMVGINTTDDTILEVRVTTHAETPGMGSRAKDDPSYAAQFKGASAAQPIKVTNDGGQINSVSGATITSRATCTAATQATEIYMKNKAQIEEQLKAFAK